MGETERIWREKTDDELIEAAGELGTYTEEGQQIIRAELKRRGLEDPVEQAQLTAAALGIEPPEPDDAGHPAPICLRCEVRLTYVGEKRFREGGNWGVLGELGHLFERSETFQVYVCRQCGHVDFFVDASDE